MISFKEHLRRIPLWAYLLVAWVIIVNLLYLYYKFQLPESGSVIEYKSGRYVYTYITPGSPAERAGLKEGDICLTINSYTMEEWIDRQRVKAGDTLNIKIDRDGSGMMVKVVPGMRNAEFAWFTIFMSVLMILVSIAGLYVLSKKPGDLAVRLFFLVVISLAICHNAIDLPFPELMASITIFGFCMFVGVLQPFLVHFHLVFPRRSSLIMKYPWLPASFYIIGAACQFFYFGAYVPAIFISANQYSSIYILSNRIILGWMTFSYSVAFAIAIYQYIRIKDTLARNQLRVVIIGTFFAFAPPIIYTFLYNYINTLEQYFPFLLQLSSDLGALILVICLLIAIFRFRIWNTEIVIRKALLYLAATVIITASYFLLIYLADQMSSSESRLVRALIIALSILIFLIFRDVIQRLIDRLFHREPYDSAKVVDDFEGKLAGVYNQEVLKEMISQGLDEIFHFKNFMFSMKKEQFCYEPVYMLGLDHGKVRGSLIFSKELEYQLAKAKVFSPGELNEIPPVFEEIKGELIVPLLESNSPAGFFVCGQKRSERVYSMQDIRVLSLLAKRIIALFNTARLYQKDLDRQLMLERERTRISQDMHDDVGASLTRISILSELAKNRPDVSGETGQWLGQISDTSRSVMEEMNQIIWALNPRNDTLEGLIAYIRRFASEYLEPTNTGYEFDFPDEIPGTPLTVEVRRNIYLCVREALHNIVKHSGAQNVKISLIRNEHQFSIIVKDDGIGFNPADLNKSGNGLINMKKRMADIGGGFALNTVRGQGTEITLTS